METSRTPPARHAVAVAVVLLTFSAKGPSSGWSARDRR